jgi:hypothetical protein
MAEEVPQGVSLHLERVDFLMEVTQLVRNLGVQLIQAYQGTYYSTTSLSGVVGTRTPCKSRHVIVG